MQLLRDKMFNANLDYEILEDWGHVTFVLGEYMSEFYRGIAEKYILPSTRA